MRQGGRKSEEVHTDGGTPVARGVQSPGASERQCQAASESPTNGEEAGIFILQFPSVIDEGGPGKCTLSGTSSQQKLPANMRTVLRGPLGWAEGIQAGHSWLLQLGISLS